jgi:hypothetical protein
MGAIETSIADDGGMHGVEIHNVEWCIANVRMGIENIIFIKHDTHAGSTCNSSDGTKQRGSPSDSVDGPDAVANCSIQGPN